MVDRLPINFPPRGSAQIPEIAIKIRHRAPRRFAPIGTRFVQDGRSPIFSCLYLLLLLLLLSLLGFDALRRRIFEFLKRNFNFNT